MQVKFTVRYHFTSVRVAIAEKTRNNKCCWGYGEKGTLELCWWGHKMI